MSHKTREYPEAMTRAISQDELTATLPSVLAAVRTDRFVIQDEKGLAIAAVISPEDYERLHSAAVEDAISAMREFGEHLQSVASPEEIAELERELDRKA